MRTKSTQFRGVPVSRRQALWTLGAAGALTAATSLPVARPARAQAQVTLRWGSPQSSPAQLAAYKFQIAQFEAAHPGIKANFEPTSDDGSPAQIAAAYATGEAPALLPPTPSFP